MRLHLTTCALALSLTMSFPAVARDLVERRIDGAGAVPVTAEIWVDNWYTLHVNGQKIAEDSTPYKTERSFNADRLTFQADLPATVCGCRPVDRR